MPKPKLQKEEKRNHKVEVSFNEREYGYINEKAKQAKQPLARLIREISLDCFEELQVAGTSDQSAKRTMRIHDLIHELYEHRRRSHNDLLVLQKQSESFCFSAEELASWKSLFDELRALNQELMGYADR